MWRQHARGELWRSRTPFFLMQGVLKSVGCPSAWFGQCPILPGKDATNLLAPNHSFCHPFMVVATADQRTPTLPSQQQLQTWLSRAWIAICYPSLYYCGQLTPLPISITCFDRSAIECPGWTLLILSVFLGQLRKQSASPQYTLLPCYCFSSLFLMRFLILWKQKLNAFGTNWPWYYLD